MTKEAIDKLVAPYLESAQTVCVLNNSEVYVDNDIESMKLNAKQRGVEIVIYKEKAPSKKVVEVEEAPVTPKSKKK